MTSAVRSASSAFTCTGETTITSRHSPERYADGWRVLTPDREVLAEHKLAHNQENGYSGGTVTVNVAR